MNSLRKNYRPRIGLYSMGLKAYWAQFEGLKERLLGYGKFIAEKLEKEADVFYFGLSDDETSARKAGEYFNENHVDLVFGHCATYATSASVIPIHQMCKAPAVILNLQPAMRVNYEKTTTGEWLAHCGACVAIELADAFERNGIRYRVVNGLLGLSKTPAISLTDEVTDTTQEAAAAWNEIGEWVRAAKVMRMLRGARFGFLGNTYSGMLDMYTDYTLFHRATGAHVEMLEMCDLNSLLKDVTAAEIAEKRTEIEEMFEISGDSPADPLAKKPTEEQLQWSATVAAAQEKLVHRYDLNALAYYYHGRDESVYERLQSGFIVGHSLLTAKGIPCSGEGDLKTALAMKICDTLGIGGSFCEIIVTDYVDKTILLGHDGPFHIAIASGKPILRGMGLYHGKMGSGVSVEAKVRAGDVTNLGVTQLSDGRFRMIVSEGVATNGQIMAIGNTQTPVRFSEHPDIYMRKWFSLAPTHHFAMSVGKNASQLTKVADLMDCECNIV